MRYVPDSIVKPPYAETGVVPRYNESRIKEPDVIERMRVAGAAAKDILRRAGEMVRPGITTDEIDIFVHDACIAMGGYPSPLNYHGYPKSVCTSVNEVICHGIPDSRVLEDGDVINLDVTIYLNGVHGDTNATFAVGNISEQDQHLIGDEDNAAMGESIQIICGKEVATAAQQLLLALWATKTHVLKGGVRSDIEMQKLIDKFKECHQKFIDAARIELGIEPRKE